MEDAAISDPRKYVKLAELLRARIAGGQIGPGDRLPTIAALAEEQDVSRHTVGKALQLLAYQGVIQRVAGLGYFAMGRRPAVAGPPAVAWPPGDPVLGK